MLELLPAGSNNAIGAQLQGILDTKFAPGAISTIVRTTRAEILRRNASFADCIKYELMLSSIKSGPMISPRFIHLQHSLLNNESKWCMIVRDDARASVQQKLGNQAEIGQMNLLSLTELMAKSPEATLRDLAIYDKILVDGPIRREVDKLLGPRMIESGYFAIAIDLNADDLVEKVKCGLRTTRYAPAGNLAQSIEVGAEWMSDDAIAENIIDFVTKIDEIHFGGIANVRQIIFKGRDYIQAIDMQRTITHEIMGAALLLDQPESIWSLSWWKKRPEYMCIAIIAGLVVFFAIIWAIYFGLKSLFA